MVSSALWKRRRDQRDLLVKAAGVSTVRLICHEDTWSFITTGCAKAGPAGQLEAEPTSLPDAEHMVAVRLSGPNLVKLLRQMNRWVDPELIIIPTPFSKEDRAIRKRVYLAVSEVISQVDAAAKPGTPIPDIVIDDQMGNPAGT